MGGLGRRTAVGVVVVLAALAPCVSSGAVESDPAAPLAGPVLVPLVGGQLPDTGSAPSGTGSAPSGTGSVPDDTDSATSGSGSGQAGSGSAQAGSGSAQAGSGSPPSPPTEAGSAPPGTATGSSPSAAPDGGVGSPLDPDAVAATLDPLLAGGALGSGRTPAVVVDVATGETLYSRRDRPTTPASTMKLVTALSALDALGADATLLTRTVVLNPAAETPRVVVVGGGDPSLTSTDTAVGGAGTSVPTESMRDLAERTTRALTATCIDTVRVGFDDSLFSGPALHPTWADAFPALGVVAPVSALVVDQGRFSPDGTARTSDPARKAAGTFATELERAGIAVRGRPKQVEAQAESAPLAQVSSASVGRLVERMLATSDNDYAEILARLAARASGHPASFEGVAARAAEVLAEHAIDTDGARFADGSGLSRSDTLEPGTLTDLLRLTSASFGDVASGLAVAGSTGSLHARFDTKPTLPARGLVRAKTGTLTGVVGLAGYVSRPDGRLLAFAVLDADAPGGADASREQVDRAVAALVSCDCAAQ